MKIKVGFFSILLFSSLLLFHSQFAFASFLAIFIHEVGHIILAKLFNIEFSECSIGIFGAGLMPRHTHYSYKDEILLAAGGPLINICSAIVVLPFLSVFYNDFLIYFILSSVALALFNIMPIKDLDGGRILYSIICIVKNERIATFLVSLLSFLTLFLLWVFSVYFLLIASSNLSLFIFSVSIFFKLFVEKI